MSSFMRHLTAIFILTCCMTGAAFAHSVYIFAWMDGTQVCTESYFSPKNKVRGGEVKMMTLVGETLAHGTTAEDGLLCFPLPEKSQPLAFTVLAGTGHQGSFRLDSKESDATTSTASTTATAPSSLTHDYPTPCSTISDEVLRQVIREELQQQLSPLRQSIAEKMEDKTPGIREIVGGIGWLIGLAALASWWSQRRKET